ncbi:hypothetical protein WJX84_007174 [Apatococcus fuscideae]|uniref:Uncharacterized protein n=1 Tax=Apatococcus fuscideae TaxID=2026836 RepID=A0AAW1T8Z3_9CHLO
MQQAEETENSQKQADQVQTENDALRAKISELQANLDHERSAKRTAKQAEIPSAPLPRKMPSSQAGPSRIDGLGSVSAGIPGKKPWFQAEQPGTAATACWN